MELFALQIASVKHCATRLLEEVILRFIANVMQKLIHCLDIDQTLTPVYHPQSNMVDRKNRDLKAQLAILVGDNLSSWPDKLSSIRFAMNCARCSSTRCSATLLRNFIHRTMHIVT